jgi:hypothetical protein
MLTGMLWFDNDPKTTLTAKVVRAAEYYREKYGKVPDTCLVNERMLPSPQPQSAGGMEVGRVTVKGWRGILPGHLWIGCKEK